MAAPARAPRPRGAIIGASLALLAVGATATAAVLVDGYDSQEVPRLESTVWVTRDNGQYARVNTDLGQIDTVRVVADPAGVIQAGAHSVIFTQGYSQAWAVNPAFPRDLVAAGESGGAGAVASPTPAGTRMVVANSTTVAMLTSTGEVYVSKFPEADAASLGAMRVDPFAAVEVAEDEEPPHYTADAIALDDAGRLAMYSDAEQSVRVFDTTRAVFVGEPTVLGQSAGAGTDTAMTLVDGSWVLYHRTTGELWIQGGDGPVDTGLGGDALLQGTASLGAVAYLADAEGMVAVTLRTGEVERVAEATGTPATPVVVGGVAYGAWLTTTEGTLWSSTVGTAPLTVPAGALDDVVAVSPVFRTNGDRTVLSETGAGLLWMVPSGTLIPTDEWDPLDDEDELEGTVVVEDVLEQEPPVAVNDAFGVRAGSLVALPLLLNDHDPNKKDVLTIDAGSLSGFSDSGFGTVSLADDNQQAVVRVAGGEGTATFTYAVSDGYTTSEPATVTLTVVPDDVNTAPLWCGVEECTQVWPTPQIAPGGFVTVPVLNGWVDPEGDVFALTDAVADDPTAPITVVPMADGRVAIRHLDPNGSEGVITLTLTVTDAWGATTEVPLELRVTAAPALAVEPVALTGVMNEARHFAIADFVSGGSGAYRLVDAVASPGSGDLVVTPVAANGTVQLLAPRAGEFLATFTVEDVSTLAQQTATVRLTVFEGGQSISLPPLVAFVRAHEDVTLDVLATAQNTTGRVLMVSQATTAETNLSVSVVDQTFVRLSGTTASGEPGRIGVADVVVTDGAGTSAATQITAFLLPAMQGVNPIAAPDSVVVRAGAQVDVPVLANDIGPRGQRLQLLADVEGSGADGELAFGAGATVRYLAPTVPGVYTVNYTAYLESNPQRFDVGTLTVTVLAPGSNRAPEPVALTGRVLSGQVLAIPFTSVGVDPDGDDVFLVDVTQPGAGKGAAWVGPSGRTIYYRAPAGEVPGGQVSFEYEVADANGATASAAVRIGIMPAAQADVAPVTFADYVRAQVDSPYPLTVMPLLNDRDPLRSPLTVVDIRPNAPEGTSEYDRLAALIDEAGTDLAAGVVSVTAGDTPGVHSYVYTVQSESTLSTAEGLVVVAVAEDPSPDHLTVADTTVTARTLSELATGVDVVTGKVQWATGDPSTLTLKVWGDAGQDYTASGWSISGPVPTDRTVIPFSLSGTDSAGNEVVTYGFLRIPAFDDMRVQLKAGVEPVRVGEEESESFSVASMVDISPLDTLEVRSEGDFAVQRDNSTCTLTGSDTVTYTAGREAPWTDTCSVAVRLAGQSVWSIIAVPITIIPKDPQAILNPMSRTIAPAQSETVSMVADMITWEGGRAGSTSDLNLVASYSGTAFEVTQQGTEVTFLAHADAKPGTRENVTVTSAAYGGLTATISLVVGVAAPDAPRGATFTQQCDVSRASTCALTVVGVHGEYDPFAGVVGSGLTLTRVGANGTVTCPVATVTQLSESQVSASWPAGAKPAGGECVVDFTVADAQGRTGQGQLTIDVAGYPQPPSSVVTRGYSESTVTLRVALGRASEAHPALTGVAIYEGDALVTRDCTPANGGSYDCVISGLVAGAKHVYTARAVNSVGESEATQPVETWAYQAPTATFTAVPVADAGAIAPGNTTDGRVILTVTSSDDTTQLMVVTPAGTTSVPRTSSPQVIERNLPLGTQQVSVTPINEVGPPISGESNSGSTSQQTVLVVGRPTFAAAPTVSATRDAITVSGVSLNSGGALAGDVSWVAYAWAKGSAAPTCSVNSTGVAAVAGGGLVEASAVQTGSSGSVVLGSAVSPYVEYTVGVCGANRNDAVPFYSVASATTDVFTWVKPDAPTTGTTYTIATTATVAPNGRTFTYSLQSGPTVTSPDPEFVVLYFQGTGSTGSATFPYTQGTVPQVQVALCAAANHDYCSDATPVTPATAPTGMSVEFPPVCRADSDGYPLVSYVTISNGGFPGDVVVDYVEDHEVSASTGTYWYRVTWQGLYSSLDTLTYDTGCAIVVPPADPEPDPGIGDGDG